jgi:Kef-type K+ transport system membrane component KefB
VLSALPRSVPRQIGVYAFFVGVPLLLLMLTLRYGAGLPAPTGAIAARPSGPAPSSFDLGSLILQLLVIVGAARLCGAALSRLGQPRVVGEMLAGILLGPSVLGHLAPTLSVSLFPAGSLVPLQALAQVGVLLFMFVVGMNLDLGQLRRHGRTAVITSHASIIAPFLLGAALSLALYSRFAPAGVPFASFALFMGAAMSVTAFPVLARILSDRGLTRTPLGIMAIACAAVDDVTAWCILAVVVVVARAGTLNELGPALLGTAVYLLVMFAVVRPTLGALVLRLRGRDGSAEPLLAAVMLLAFASAWITERLGIHALFGAFLVGALMPSSEPVVATLVERLRDLMVVLLLPVYFAFTGLRTSIGLLSSPGLWGVCVVVLLVAILGKLGGTTVAARSMGMRWRQAFALGALMNTRGLMELVILNVGLDIGVISPTLFTMMVIMALVTTAITTPLVTWATQGGRTTGLDGASDAR